MYIILYTYIADENRVPLEPIDNDPRTDYINANFVDVSTNVYNNNSFNLYSVLWLTPFVLHYVRMYAHLECHVRSYTYIISESTVVLSKYII